VNPAEENNDLQRLERTVLGSILRRPVALSDVAARVGVDDFSTDAHQRIFTAMLALDASCRPVDLPVLADYLVANGHLDDCGRYSYLAELLDAEPTGHNAVYYADLLRGRSVLRHLRYLASEVIANCDKPTAPPDEVLADVERAIFALGERATRGAESALVNASAIKAGDRYDARSRSGALGIPMGWIDLDHKAGGLRDSEVTVLAARPGQGKSALASQIVVNAAKAGFPVFLASLEMHRDELTDRMICSEVKIDLHRWRNAMCSPEQLDFAAYGSRTIAALPIHIDDAAGQSMARIVANARRLKRRDGIKLIVIDYLQLIEPEDRKAPRHEQVGVMSRRLKTLAKELSVPVLALSQLNRAAENHERPKLSNLRESGSIEQDADIVLLMHRPDGEGEIVEVEVAKNRNGPTGVVPLTFIRHFVRFENAAFGPPPGD
jgi:replicative DNA helicase